MGFMQEICQQHHQGSGRQHFQGVLAGGELPNMNLRAWVTTTRDEVHLTCGHAPQCWGARISGLTVWSLGLGLRPTSSTPGRARRAKRPGPTRAKAGSWPQEEAMELLAMRRSSHCLAPRSCTRATSSPTASPPAPASRSACNHDGYYEMSRWCQDAVVPAVHVMSM